jgi:Family of unknown function (DUF6065)
VEPPVVEFFRGSDQVPLPVPASETVGGFLPARAKQYCPPVSHASGFGWWLFPPISFALRWDGQYTDFATIDDTGNPTGDWRSLAGGVDVPLEANTGLVERIRRLHGDEQADLLFPDGLGFLNADPRAMNHIELTTGIAARTSPGWSLLIRSVPNWPTRAIQNIEGIIEADWYRSLIPVMLRIAEPGVHNVFRHIPIGCAQPIHQAGYLPGVHQHGIIHDDPDDLFSGDTFDEFRSSRQGRAQGAGGEPPPMGNYRTLQRRARATGACPYPADLDDHDVADTEID